jgi:branched-chain amino acid transport system substrate-binding protein
VSPRAAQSAPMRACSATLAYLKAVKAPGTKDTEVVAEKLKEQFAKGTVLENGRMVPDLSMVPVDEAFPAAKDSGCLLVK